MSPMPSKSYGADAIVSPSNPTLKRVNTLNSPLSAEATGLDHVPSKHIPVTSENLNALETNTRVLEGNIEKYVKTVTKTGVAPDEVLTSAVIAWSDDKDVEQTQTLTKAQFLASTTIFLANQA